MKRLVSQDEYNFLKRPNQHLIDFIGEYANTGSSIEMK